MREDLSEIEKVLHQQEDTLMTTPGVTGVAIGRSPMGDPAIIIYLKDQRFQKDFPKWIDGHPVITQFTGPIKASE